MHKVNAYDGNQIVSWDKCDWKPQIEQPKRTMKLSEAIRAGHDLIDEYHEGFLQEALEGRCKGCAIGAAWVALGKSVQERNKYCGNELIGILSSITGTPHDVLSQVSHRHHRGEKRLSIASWLEAQGY